MRPTLRSHMKPSILNTNLKKVIISPLAPYNWSGLRIKRKNAYLELQDGKVNVNTIK
jgi:hypothetical protein